jgi:hypothetical protein
MKRSSELRQAEEIFRAACKEIQSLCTMPCRVTLRRKSIDELTLRKRVPMKTGASQLEVRDGTIALKSTRPRRSLAFKRAFDQW